jgi:hypothetical protein
MVIIIQFNLLFFFIKLPFDPLDAIKSTILLIAIYSQPAQFNGYLLLKDSSTASPVIWIDM